ncbi:MAG: hypothetical protein ILA19_03205 [Bacilli bacterium]|nr:hypothetical protein [Bacilli bacterium]
MMWKNLLLVLIYWLIALLIMFPVCYLAEVVSPWFWMLMIVTAPLLFIISVIFSGIADELEEKRKNKLNE